MKPTKERIMNELRRQGVKAYIDDDGSLVVVDEEKLSRLCAENRLSRDVAVVVCVSLDNP